MPYPSRNHPLSLIAPLLLLALALTGGLPLSAQTPPAPAADKPTIQAPIVVNGQTLFSVGGENPEERAQRINSRLRTLITRESDVVNFTVEREGDNVVLAVGDIPVMTVTATDAQDALMSPEDLARQWGQELTAAVQQARAERGSWIQRVVNPVRRSMNQLLDQTLEALPRIISALILLFFTYYAARLIRAGVTPVVRRTSLDDNLRQLIRSIAFYGAWIIGLMMTASVIGFQAASLVTALGVGGFVLGFAFKDILSHFLAGILLLAGRTFQIGDQIAIREFEGTVESINLRATNVRTYDNRLVIVPNADVFTSAVVNNTQSRVRRQEFDIGIDYEADIADAQLLAFQSMKETKGVMEDPAPDVLVAEFAASWVTLRCRFWTDSRRANVLAVGSEVRRRVKEALDRGGIYLPFEIREIRVGPYLEDPVVQVLRATAGDAADGDGHTPLPPVYKKAIVDRQDGKPVKHQLLKQEEDEEESAAKAEAALPQNLTAETE